MTLAKLTSKAFFPTITATYNFINPTFLATDAAGDFIYPALLNAYQLYTS